MSTGKRTLYYMLESPPCRTVLAVLRMLGLDSELQTIQVDRGEQFGEKFLRINPFHVVPTLAEPDGFILWESRAIITYLVQKYQPHSALYPAGNLQARATIDKFLHYDIGTYYRALSAVVLPLFQGKKLNLDVLPEYKNVLTLLDGFLGQNPAGFLAGDRLTLADLSLYFSLTLAEAVEETSIAAYANVVTFFSKVEQELQPHDPEGDFARARLNLKEYSKSLL